MTPGARIAAAITVLDQVLGGAPVERCLTNWGRANRYAGSGDRRALRDLVFQALRCRRSYGAFGGEDSGRGLMLGMLQARGDAVEQVFDGQGYHPAALSPAEREQLALSPQMSPDVQMDLPAWLLPRFQAQFGEDLPQVAATMQQRAPAGLRVNLQKGDLATAQASLLADQIETSPVPGVSTALIMTANAHRLRNSAAYTTGLVELQDPSSQRLVQDLPLTPGAKVLDYCAGGGGKALAILADPRAQGATMTAHDADAARMQDIPARAARAGVQIDCAQGDLPGVYDLVLVDAPCSGSGTWRRSPDSKWALTPERLDELTDLQAQILRTAAALAAPEGTLAYATCSVFEDENLMQINRFMDDVTGWTCVQQHSYAPDVMGDGFFLALFQREGRPKSA